MKIITNKEQQDLFAKAMAEERDVYPMTAAQLGIYYQCYYNPEGDMYNNTFTTPLDENVDIERLKRACQKVIVNHAVFKAELAKDERGVPGFRVNESTNRRVNESTSRRIEESTRLYSITIENNILTMSFHHLIFDGMSHKVILDEVSRAYDGLELEPESVNPVKIGLYEQMLAGTEEYERCQAIYKEMFEGKDCDTMLPYEMPETDDDNIPSREFMLRIEGKFRDALEAFLAEKKISANTLFMWAYQHALSETIGKPGIHFNIGFHGRTDALLNNCVGMFVRTLPVYIEYGEDTDLDAQFLHTKNCVKKSIIASEYPYAKVAEEFGLEYRNAFVYHGGEYTSLILGGKAYPVQMIPVHSAQTDMMIMVFKYTDSYGIRFVYRSDCYKEETIKAFAKRYIRILTSRI